MNIPKDISFSDFISTDTQQLSSRKCFDAFEYVPSQVKQDETEYPELVECPDIVPASLSLIQTDIKFPEVLEQANTEDTNPPQQDTQTPDILSRKSLQEIFKYLDTLFQSLPDDVVQEFSQSDYYSKYNALLDELEV